MKDILDVSKLKPNVIDIKMNSFATYISNLVSLSLVLVLLAGCSDSGVDENEPPEQQLEASVRIVEVNTDTEQMTLRNFGSETIDLSGYWICARPGYDRIGNADAIRIVSGDMNLVPGASLIIDVSPAGAGNFQPIVELDENGETGLFSESTFGSEDPAIFVDFVSWNGITATTRVEQAVNAGVWNSVDSFVQGTSRFSFTGGSSDFGSSFWRGEANGSATAAADDTDSSEDEDSGSGYGY